jgi:hypothetical protein
MPSHFELMIGGGIGQIGGPVSTQRARFFAAVLFAWFVLSLSGLSQANLQTIDGQRPAAAVERKGQKPVEKRLVEIRETLKNHPQEIRQTQDYETTSLQNCSTPVVIACVGGVHSNCPI